MRPIGGLRLPGGLPAGLARAVSAQGLAGWRGPLYQGAIELQEEDVDRDAIEASSTRVPRPDPSQTWQVIERNRWPVWLKGIRQRESVYRQPSAGATWVRMLSMTWAL